MERQSLYRVKESPLLIQRLAIDHSKDIFPMLVKGFLIIFVLATVIPSIIEFFYPESYWEYLDARSSAFNPSKELLEAMPQLALSKMIYVFLFAGVIETGKALYILTFIRARRTDYVAITEGFRIYFRTLALAAAKTLIISFGFMLFIIPGIISYYSFRQAYFILADDPRKGAMTCLAESRIRMNGNKMSLFRLDISYLSLIMVSYIPIIIAGLFGGIDITKLSGLLIVLLLNIPLTIATNWMAVGQGIFYELLITGGFDKFKYSGETAFREGVNRYKVQV